MSNQRSQEFNRSKTSKRRSAIRQSSSLSRKSIRKSTTETDAQEVTSFAYYVQNFFSNIFGCCGGGDESKKAARKGNDVRQSIVSNNSQVLQYSFVVEEKNANNMRRSRLIKDFKEKSSKTGSILKNSKDEGEKR